MEYVNCNLCGGESTRPFFQLPDLLLGRPEVSSTLVQCCQCGLIYQNPRPTLAEMATHYPAEYESYAPEPDGARSSALARRAVQYGMDKRVHFVTQHKSGGRLLDVGCASGIFLSAAQRHGNWQVTGIEVNESVARAARERYGLDVRAGTLEEAAFPAESFDAITLWDVLEHLHNPAASLGEIHRILKPDGVLVLRVPNAASWDARWFGRHWAGWDVPRHLYAFTPTTLQSMLTVHRFRSVSWNTGSGAYPTFVLSLRFWNNARPQSRRGARLIQWLYHPILRVGLAPVFFLSGLARRGPLMVMIAKKQGGETA